jgi:hypothetical protein
MTNEQEKGLLVTGLIFTMIILIVSITANIGQSFSYTDLQKEAIEANAAHWEADENSQPVLKFGCHGE